MKLSDREIRDMAEHCGFYGLQLWWDDNISKFRKLLEMANNPTENCPICSGSFKDGVLQLRFFGTGKS